MKMFKTSKYPVKCVRVNCDEHKLYHTKNHNVIELDEIAYNYWKEIESIGTVSGQDIISFLVKSFNLQGEELLSACDDINELNKFLLEVEFLEEIG